jgi:hypothetical protein
MLGLSHPGAGVTGFWLPGVFIAFAVLLVVGLIWVLNRWLIASDGLTAAERKRLGYWEREILSMLRQQGGPLSQKEIVDMLSGDLEELAAALHDMEEQGLVHRKWQAEQQTYLVSTGRAPSGDTGGR